MILYFSILFQVIPLTSPLCNLQHFFHSTPSFYSSVLFFHSILLQLHKMFFPYFHFLDRKSTNLIFLFQFSFSIILFYLDFLSIAKIILLSFCANFQNITSFSFPLPISFMPAHLFEFSVLFHLLLYSLLSKDFCLQFKFMYFHFFPGTFLWLLRSLSFSSYISFRI